MTWRWCPLRWRSPAPVRAPCGCCVLARLLLSRASVAVVRPSLPVPLPLPPLRIFALARYPKSAHRTNTSPALPLHLRAGERLLAVLVGETKDSGQNMHKFVLAPPGVLGV